MCSKSIPIGYLLSITREKNNNKSFKNEKCLPLLLPFHFFKTLTLTQQKHVLLHFCKTPCNYTKIKSA